MHEIVLSQHSVELLDRLAGLQAPELDGWTVAGGTGLALRIGHRFSDDFDFFRTDRMDVRRLHEPLSKTGPYETLQEEEHTLTVLLNHTKVSFFSVNTPFLFPMELYRFFRLADIRDIALMKLAAVSGRGSRKDFVDLYMILQDPPSLADYFEWMSNKYGARFDAYHVLKSLTWFEDAEGEPMPRMRVPFNWDDCKAFFIRAAHGIVLS